MSVNGFTKFPANVIVYMRLMRRGMAHFGDRRKPLLATELSWPSAQGKIPGGYDFDTTESGQARNIAALLPLIGAARASLRLIGFYYYTWISDAAEVNSGFGAFSYAGLLKIQGTQVAAKPALGAFRKGALALEHCSRKGAVATACVK